MGVLQRLVTIVCILLSVSSAVLADDYPSRLVKIIVPFPPGATTDFVGRVVAGYLKARTGQTVVVENIAGAGGNLGMAAAAKADPDGYTLVIVASSLFTINPHLYGNLSFDPVKDIAPVGLVGEAPTIFAVNKDVPAKTLQELFALARTGPSKYSYGSAGVGTPLHLSVARLARQARVEFLHVPYRGGAAAINDLLAGRVQVIGIDPSSLLQHVQNGSVRALAIAADRRLSIFPGVPTVAEAGLQGFEDSVWWGIGAPRNTPVSVLDKLNMLLRGAVADPAFKEKLATIHLQLLFESRVEIEKRISVERAGVISLSPTASRLTEAPLQLDSLADEARAQNRDDK